jgi:aminoglycoside phosphotransferase (APT) family kinase protein
MTTLHPAFQGFDEVVPLAGFSGASIAILRRSGQASFVRKAANDLESNAGLIAQARRQLWLRTQLEGAVNVPAVFEQGEIQSLCYFDMEFVRSRDANSFLISANFRELSEFAERVEEMIKCMSQKSLIGEAAEPTLEPFRTKLAEISKRTDGRFDALISPIEEAIDHLPRFSSDPIPTVCHGDLTFENILVSARRDLWVVDSISSPIDHYWMDWAKLFQDCEGRWHIHREKKLSIGVTRWLRNRWFSYAVRLAPDYAARHYILLSLTFARILPYAKSRADLDFVAERIRLFGQAALDNV